MEYTYIHNHQSQFIEWFGSPVSNPKGWQVVPLKEASILVSDGPFGSNLKSCHYVNHGIRVIRLQNIGVGFFDDRDKAFISESHYNVLKKYTCKPGEVVIATLGEPNLRACIVPDYIDTSINKADCIHVIPDETKLLPQFVCSYINCEETLYIATSQIHGTTRNRISGGQVSQLPIYLPQIELQKQFISVAEQADKSKFDGFKSQFIELFEGDEYPLIKLGDYTDFTWGDTNTTKNSYVTEGYLAYSASGPDGKLDHFDYDCEGIVLSAIGADCGKTWFASGKWSCIKNTIRFWSTFDDLDNRFLYFATREKDFWPRRGGAQPFIPQGDARNCSIPLPPICLQRKFVEIAEQADKSKYYEINETSYGIL